MNDHAPIRRWFRWSLRTMFVVVTILCVWFGYEVNWIHQRREFHAQYAYHRADGSRYNPAGPAPGLLWLFGEEGWYDLVLVVDADSSESLFEAERQLLPRAKRLFPEAAMNTTYVGGRQKTGVVFGFSRSGPR